MSDSVLPDIPHLAGEFYLWLWWSIDRSDSHIVLPDPVGAVDIWMDERLAFRVPGESKVTVVLTGANPSESLESRASLRGGKILDELKLGIRVADREYNATIKGPNMELRSVKLPSIIEDDLDVILHERLALYEELNHVFAALYRQFAAARTSPTWEGEVVSAIVDWANAQ